MDTPNTLNQLSEIATRIKELREIMGYSIKEMAEKTNVSEETYVIYESGNFCYNLSGTASILYPSQREILRRVFVCKRL